MRFFRAIRHTASWHNRTPNLCWRRYSCQPYNLSFRGHRIVTLLCLIVVSLSTLILISSISKYVNRQFMHQSDSPVIAFPSHMLCVLVPFRDCEYELTIFAPYISDFLKEQNVEHKIIVINQTDKLRFNRASLINVGWYEADRIGCDYMVMHDVDLLPLNRQLNYSYPGKGVVRHLSSPQYHPQYGYAKYIGGILLLTMEDFKRVNGMSNKYWGWGLEDDEFYLRLRKKFACWFHSNDRQQLATPPSDEELVVHIAKQDANLLTTLERPENLTTNRNNTFLHIHNTRVRRRDRRKIGNQLAITRRRDRFSGLNSVKYHIAKRSLRKYRNDKGPVVLVIEVELECDMKWTPYCKVLPEELR